MFKRTNKIISLLVIAAAMVSVMQTSVKAASSNELQSKKGEIYNAIAYKDGKFYIGGEPYKKDEAAYYLNDGKYSELDDIDSDDKAEIYGSKYVKVEDGDYYVDLSSGKVSDDELQEKALDDIAVALRSKIKSDNDGRIDDGDAKEIKDVTALRGAKFSDAWYETQYTAKDSSINGGAGTINVYADASGKYIDADYNIGKIKVKLSDGKTSNIQNTNNEDSNVTAQVSNAKVIGQDSNNIYRLAKITVKAVRSGVTVKEVNGITVSSSATAISASSDGTAVSFEVIQVISKNQASGKVDGIRYAKDVDSYMLSDKDGKTVELLDEDAADFTVAGGKLVNYKVDSTSIEAQLVNLKTKSSTYYIELGDYDHVKLLNGDSDVDIDSQGNLWAASDEAVYEFDNDEDFQKIYTVDDDEEYTDLSVYDKDNLIAWNADDKIYSIISKGSETSDDNGNADTGAGTGTGNTTTPGNTVQAGWVLTNGSWSYNNADGTKFKGWLQASAGVWYYLDPADGVMDTGWKYINGQWYYLDKASGAMKTGWLNDNGTWYYLKYSGEMVSDTTVDGYKLGANGAWIK
ncbi:cell wall binding repeat-containing protein [Clostridium sp. DL-VIII]|uniref:N-acetylmuramoyl-L-alanine amidase family protein n=1 Tax=Clostridium sp. DL-VIII TaxID=641107 RepID=UPI00023B071D|nr:N-acetylmuramoyl-L-alanine amidase family protein [Clostridium sp. DL-VIII]EHJ02110.1 cell wall binding repeat-containing protein [Clostridium sp. DL-VIII]